MYMSRESRAKIYLASCSGDRMPGIRAEGINFFEALLAGMIVYSSYTCIRLFRRNVSHSLAAIAAEDLVFWLGTAVYLFVRIYHTSDGSIRWHFVVGAALGVIVCYYIGRIFKKLLNCTRKKDKINEKQSFDKDG